jgi:hypothetical protein
MKSLDWKVSGDFMEPQWSMGLGEGILFTTLCRENGNDPQTYLPRFWNSDIITSQCQ